MGSEGIQVSSIDEAQDRNSTFSIVEPKNLAQPLVFVGPFPRPDKNDTSVFLVYDDQSYGRVWVHEQLPDIEDPAERMKSYQASVTESRGPDYHAIADLLTIRSDIPALIWTSDDREVIPTIIHWVEDGVQFTVLGPTLTRDQAIEIANGL